MVYFINFVVLVLVLLISPSESHISYVYGNEEVVCNQIRHIEWYAVCDFVTTTRTCKLRSYFDYMKFVFCDLPASTSSFIMIGIVLEILLVIAYVFLVSIAASFCVYNSLSIAHVLGFSEDTTGSLILPVLNSAADFIEILSEREFIDKDVQVNYKYGNAIVCIALYGGIVMLFYPFSMHYPYLIRNILCIMFSSLFVGWRLTKKEVSVHVSLLMICFWFIFAALVLIDENLAKRKYKNKILPKFYQPITIKYEINRKSSVSDAVHANSSLFLQFLKDINPIKMNEYHNGNRIRKFFLIFGSPTRLILNIFIPVVDHTIPNHGWSKLLNCFNIVATCTLTPVIYTGLRSISWIVIGFFVGLFFAICIFTTSRTDRPPPYHMIFAFFGIYSAAIITHIVSNELCGIWYLIVNVIGLSRQNIGILIHKWIITVVDLVVNLVIAGMGYRVTAFQAFLCTPILHYTFLLGIYWIKWALKEGGSYVNVIRTDNAETSVIFIQIITISILFAAGFTKFEMRRSIGVFLILCYVIFFIFIILTEFEKIHSYGSYHISDFGPEKAWEIIVSEKHKKN